MHPQGEEELCPICRILEERGETAITLEANDAHNPDEKPIEVKLKLVRDASGIETGMLISLHDLSHFRQVEERLRLAASVFENTDEGVIITDSNGNILDVNRAFSQIQGYSREEVIGKNPRLFKSGHHDQSFYRDLWHSLTETGHWRGEMWNRRKNGELFPKWQTINSVVDGNGNLTHYVGIFSDITHIKQSQEKLDHLGHHDALTDLPNRLLLNERLDQAIKHAERHNTLLAVIFLDLDNFKHINDSLGHPVGDQLLQEVARKLLLATRQDDTVARIGGDEFVLLLEDIGKPENAGIAAQKLAAVFAEPFQLEQQAIRITASLGICICPQDGNDSATLLRNADSAMYRAKEEGRNTYQFYTEELTRNAFERVSLENNLRQAIEKEQLRLLYQPQFELQSGRIIGLEALIRWVHPELGTISPARFIPLAEESGLIHPIGEWVLRTACRQGRQWQQQGIDFGRIAVNIAGPQLQRGNLVNEVIAVLDETQLPTDRLELEVTEGFIMQQAESAITQLQALRELGLTLSIDDFGTGYSSLSYLKQLPINKLKIDQSFVRDIPHDRNDMAIADAIIAMGKSLGLRVIAEGVETEAQAEFLKQAGCQEGQGYLYSKPITAEAVEALITEQPALSTE
ncbi:putative bifunctional diguanylate cyclase/phosphodiesterase [Sedimenticola selenatireducens]|uniref:cyclic-guanylate-specific phosphodiesterase n=1 Tax=Sedimenticola selenatireducens TaxID=191960 RepID=A0A2N6CSM4_9GAMM|nr:EAL domain-containing protein [Sedimenticola selenatireducens]PLX60096.1 MAG: diguanylate cyclase [Sedimenticola selenatireducens]